MTCDHVLEEWSKIRFCSLCLWEKQITVVSIHFELCLDTSQVMILLRGLSVVICEPCKWHTRQTDLGKCNWSWWPGGSPDDMSSSNCCTYLRRSERTCHCHTGIRQLLSTRGRHLSTNQWSRVTPADSWLIKCCANRFLCERANDNLAAAKSNFKAKAQCTYLKRNVNIWCRK